MSLEERWRVLHLKDGDHEVQNNNRPISLLPVLSKVAERIALAQFNNYLTQKNHLTCHQSRNRKHHSTETLSLLVSDHIFSAMVKKQITPVVLIDVNKAFNSLCYPNYRSWALPTKLFYGSKVTLQTDNSSLVLQLHCLNHSLSHMAYLRAQFSAQRFSACTWTIYPKSSSLVTQNLTLMALRYISRLRQKTLIHVYAKLLRISNMFSRVVLRQPSFD